MVQCVRVLAGKPDDLSSIPRSQQEENNYSWKFSSVPTYVPWVCACMCTRVCIHVHCVCIHACVHVCPCGHVHVCTDVHVCACVVCVHVCTCVYMSTGTLTQTGTNILAFKREVDQSF